jgi:hypothetical protein
VSCQGCHQRRAELPQCSSCLSAAAALVQQLPQCSSCPSAASTPVQHLIDLAWGLQPAGIESLLTYWRARTNPQGSPSLPAKRNVSLNPVAASQRRLFSPSDLLHHNRGLQPAGLLPSHRLHLGRRVQLAKVCTQDLLNFLLPPLCLVDKQGPHQHQHPQPITNPIPKRDRIPLLAHSLSTPTLCVSAYKRPTGACQSYVPTTANCASPTYAQSSYNRPNLPKSYLHYSLPKFSLCYSLPKFSLRYSLTKFSIRYSLPKFSIRYSLPRSYLCYGLPASYLHYNLPMSYLH